jgi:YD repeat-containing protein
MQKSKQFILLLLLLAASALQSQAQNTVKYTYDQAGNRLLRTIALGQQDVKRNYQPTDSVVIKETIGEHTIKVFPNPTRGALGVDIQGVDPKQELRLIMYSGAGAVLYNQPATEGINPIDMTQYPQGWYVLRVVAGTEKREYKIVKE